MHFIIGKIESVSWWTAQGAIGLVYDSIFGAIVSYLIFAIFCILAIIGLKTVVLKTLFGGQKKKDKH